MSIHHESDERADRDAQNAAHADGLLVKAVAHAVRRVRDDIENVAADANFEDVADAAREALDALDNFVADELAGGMAFLVQSRGERAGINLDMESAVLAIYESTPDKEDVQ